MHCAACTPNTVQTVTGYITFRSPLRWSRLRALQFMLQCCSVGPIFKVIFNICGVVVCVSAWGARCLYRNIRDPQMHARYCLVSKCKCKWWWVVYPSHWVTLLSVHWHWSPQWPHANGQTIGRLKMSSAQALLSLMLMTLLFGTDKIFWNSNSTLDIFSFSQLITNKSS